MTTDDGLNLEQQLLEKLLAERAELDQQIAFLEKRLGRSATTEPAVRTGDASVLVTKGEFFGLSRAEAAIALLKKLRRTLSTNEIFSALADSGLDMSGKNTMGALYTALARRPETKKVAKNTWGLKEWYPHLRDQPKKRNDSSPAELQTNLEPDAALDR